MLGVLRLNTFIYANSLIYCVSIESFQNDVKLMFFHNRYNSCLWVLCVLLRCGVVVLFVHMCVVRAFVVLFMLVCGSNS